MKTLKLADYIFEVNDKTTSNDQYPVLTSSQDGIVMQSEYFNKKVASRDTTGYKIVRFGQFTYRAMSDTGKFYINRQECCDLGIVSPAYPVFGVKSSAELVPEFLQMFFQTDYFQSLIANQSRGSTRVSLKLPQIKALEIHVPSYDEQLAVVARLRKLEAIIGACKKQQQCIDKLVKSRFVEMFGTEKEFYKWDNVSVGDVAEVCVGVVIKPTQYYTSEGIPAFRSLNIGEMYVKDAGWVYFTEEGHLKNRKSVIRENDVLVVRSGAPGTACVATEKYAGYNAVDIIIAHPDSEKVNPCFLAAFTNMPHGKNQIKEKTGGAAQQHFNVGGYKALKLILPPIKIQNEFAAFIHSADQTKRSVRRSLAALETLKKSLMQSWFG